jgi:hypothetical protein
MQDKLSDEQSPDLVGEPKFKRAPVRRADLNDNLCKLKRFEKPLVAYGTARSSRSPKCLSPSPDATHAENRAAIAKRIYLRQRGRALTRGGERLLWSSLE